MNHAKLQNSMRLKRVMAVLRKGGAYTTRDLIRRAHVCAVNSIISALRENGKRIDCFRKGRKYYYMLVRV